MHTKRRNKYTAAELFSIKNNGSYEIPVGKHLLLKDVV